MGQEIVYCHSCKNRLTGRDFEKGKAFRIENNTLCLACAKKTLDSLPPAEREAFAARLKPPEAKKASSPHLPVARPPGLTSSSTRLRALRESLPAEEPAEEQGTPRVRPMILAFGIGSAFVIVGIIILIVVAFSGRRPGPGTGGPTPPPPPPPPPAADSPAQQAKRLFDAAVDWQKANPDDFTGQIERFQKALWAAPGSAVAEASTREIDAVKVRRSQKIARDFEELDAQLKPLLDGGDFDGAVRLLETARPGHAERDWEFGIERRLGEVQTRREAPPPPPPDPWVVLSPEEVKASSGASLRRLDDGSILGPREGPSQETFTMTARADLKGITAFRLEAMSDASLPRGGPGCAGNGNFVLSGFRVETGGRALAFRGVSTTHEQGGWPGSAAIDGDPLTGWATQPRPGRDHAAVFHLLEPVDGGAFTFLLEHLTTQPRHVLGRFRISATAAALPPPPPPRPAEKSPPPVPPAVRAYRERWSAAALHAAARDYAAAVQAQEAALAEVAEPQLKSEASADLADLKLAAALHDGAMEILSKWPAGRNLPVEIVGGDFKKIRLDEPLRRVEGRRFEIRPSSGVSAFGTGEVTAGSLAGLFLSRGERAPSDARAAGIFCALEGDLEAARRHLGKDLPGKLVEHAGQIPPPDEGTEAEARRRLREAANGFFDPAERARALETFASLLKDHGDTLVVRRSKASLQAGPEALQEFYFAATDLKPAGHFALQNHAKGQIAWTMGEDVPEKERRGDHYLEAAYSAAAGSEYRAWVLAGGCCHETFTFHLQATDLEAPGSETSTILVSCEPGGEVMTPVLPSLVGLRKTHASHGGGPKVPSRFDWVALPALKHPSSGTKRVRLISDQQGFSAAALLVSSVRKTAPRESELRELEAGRPCAWDLLESPGAASPGWILREVWYGIPGGRITDLAGHASFRGRPAKTEKLTAFDAPNRGENGFVGRLRGYLLPPLSGPYVFFLCSDDESELWLSGDENPSGRKRIAHLEGAVGSGDWEGRPTQKSTPIILIKGRRYYIEALYHGGGGTDHLRVGWKLPEGTMERPIPGSRLAPHIGGQTGAIGVSLSCQAPADPPKTAVNVPVTVQVSGAESPRIEIYRGGQRLGDARGNPPSFTWYRVPEGGYFLTARVVDRNGRVALSETAGLTVGEVCFTRAVDLNGSTGRIDGCPWSGRETGGYEASGSGFERRDVELRPPANAARARMIRSSVFSKEGTKVTLTAVPPGKYQVYLTLWEPGDNPQAFDVAVNGKSVVTGHKFLGAGDWARLGPWPAEPVEGKIEVAAARGTAHFSGVELWALGAPPKPTERVKSERVGGGGGNEFEETRGGDPFLVGFRITGKDLLKSIQGIWLEGEAKVTGETHGGTSGGVTEIVARPGYAVGGLRMRGDDRVRSFRVVFMKIVGAALNPADSYETDWLIGNERDTKLLGGDGAPVVGLHGRRGGDVDCLGIIQLR